jgi:hypothetical protein
MYKHIVECEDVNRLFLQVYRKLKPEARTLMTFTT